jgi:hypothetical protein
MVLFLAFSLQAQVEKYGAYIGIAAFFGLAVLSLLYFSQARELKRLREWAGRAPERAQEIEARVTAQASEAVRAQTAPATAAGSAAGARAASAVGGGGVATQVVEETAQSGNGTAHAAEEAEHHENGAVTTAPEDLVEVTEAGAAAQMGEPPTEVAEPGEDAEPVAAAEDAEPPGAVEALASEGAEPAGEAEGLEPADDAAEPEGVIAAEPVATGGDAEVVEVGEAGEAAQADVPQPDEEEPESAEMPVLPRATPLPRREPAPAKPAAAALRQRSPSAVLPPRPAAARLTQSGGDSHRLRNGLLAGVGLVVILVGVLFATGVIGGSDKPAPPAANSTSTSGTSTASPSGGTQAEPALTPKSTKVAVLNGTTIGGLASTEADKLRAAGYTGKVTTGNNTDQQRASSSVMYGGRSGARNQARTVARRLDISTVQRLDADTRDLSENADVVVILGQDKAP